MSNDSTSSGYLTPVGAMPDYDEELERQISRWIRAVSGLPAKMVLPRWTETQPKIPAAGTNWCAFGIMDFDNEHSPAAVQLSAHHHEQWSHESMQILCCFYGPQGQRIATQFRDGLFVSQNNAELSRVNLSYIDCGRIRPAPELINNQWVRRYDITVTLRRKVVREYGIKTIVDAPVKFFGE
ncbi:phage neck terminator protein [Providencia hangzhouensis]|uniref:phage neck terminator protein n=1 Tax=Providencia hangzhouensis TaxID=3031799 RepID=UPI0039F63115